MNLPGAMNLRALPARLWSVLRHPRPTVRWRLALLYGGLFLVSGAALLAVTYTLVDHATLARGPNFTTVQAPASRGAGPPGRGIRARAGANGDVGQVTLPPPVTKLLRSRSGRFAVAFVGSSQRIADLHQLVIESAIALAVMALISAVLGWAIAGRVLRPLRTITAATHQISDVNLHERLAMPGPRDELRELADTIDGLLERLQGAFDAQRRFVANASHELRTPLTATRALLEMVLIDPQATTESFREACHQALEESEQQEQLIDALLALAQGQRGIEHRERLDLAVITDDVLRRLKPDVAARGLELEAAIEPAPLPGDSRLISRAVENLIENAIRHNAPGGHIWVRARSNGTRTTLSVANTGPIVPGDEVDRLLQPFQRLAPDRTGYADGVGLGLSIVAAIADAHDAALAVDAPPGGGLAVELSFPAGGASKDPDAKLTDVASTPAAGPAAPTETPAGRPR